MLGLRLHAEKHVPKGSMKNPYFLTKALHAGRPQASVETHAVLLGQSLRVVNPESRGKYVQYKLLAGPNPMARRSTNIEGFLQGMLDPCHSEGSEHNEYLVGQTILQLRTIYLTIREGTRYNG
jgi:hypothetical protein